MIRRTLLVAMAAALIVLPPAATSVSATSVEVHEGVLDDGVTPYRFEVPASWRGTLLLDLDFGARGHVRDWLLDSGVALAGTVRGPGGWDIARHVDNQIETLDTFVDIVGEPAHTISWGRSRGGVVSRAVIDAHPQRFDGALPMCGGGAGSIAMWNYKLDAMFALDTLVAPGSGLDLELVDLNDPGAETQALSDLVAYAQSTPEGRARVALAGALARIPTWVSANRPEPASDNYATRQANVAAVLPFAMGIPFLYEIEQLAGGPFTWNHGVDYRVELARSGYADVVRAMYDEAGTDLKDDLETLEEAPRVSADPEAVAYVERENVTYLGHLRMPVLTLMTTGDPAGPVNDEAAYRSAVQVRGSGAMLRQAFVHRGGHCSFTDSEQMAAFGALFKRIETGRWSNAASTQSLNMSAKALDDRTAADLGPAAFVNLRPPPHTRPWDGRNWGTYEPA